MSDYLGKQFGNYRLIKLLGEGAFAQVYLGEHVHIGTQAAIKVLTTKLTEELIAQFRDEARTIMNLEHTNIVRVLDFDLQGRIPFIVTSYAPGGSLRKRHPNGTPLALPIVVTYVKQIASALQYAHDRKLIHRDVKPDNMLIGRNNEVLLSDFGIAVIAHSTRSLSTEQFVSGTFFYMAPEQIQGKPRLASDQYALGIVVYEWLTGMPPFIGTATEIGMQHLLTPPSPLREKVPTLPPEVEQVVLKALAKDPHLRFESVLKFGETLEQIVTPGHPVSLPSINPVPIAIVESDASANQKTKEQWLKEANAYHNAKQYNSSIKAYSQALLLDSMDPEIYFFRGMDYMMMKTYQKAFEDFNRAIALNPRYAEGYEGLAHAYYAIEDYQRAILECDNALKYCSHWAVASIKILRETANIHLKKK
jgi:serine/threonine protein kinase